MRSAFGTVVMSLDFAIALWPVSVLVLAAATWGATALLRARKVRTWQTLTVLGSLLFPVAIVPLYTMQFWANPRVHSPQTQEVPLSVLIAAWVLFAFGLLVSIAKARGFRWPLAGIASVVVWFAAGVYIVSVMAVSGVWL